MISCNRTTLIYIGVNPGVCVGFSDPEKGVHDTYSRKDDIRDEKRMENNNRAQVARRAIRFLRKVVLDKGKLS